jgi:hypothetical protein
MNFLKKIWLELNRCRHQDRVKISLSLYNRREENGGIHCFLHYCPICGELLEEGKAAQFRKEKVGNYYTLRQSFKMAKEIFAEHNCAKIAKLNNEKYVMRFDKNGLFAYFKLKEKKNGN